MYGSRSSRVGTRVRRSLLILAGSGLLLLAGCGGAASSSPSASKPAPAAAPAATPAKPAASTQAPAAAATPAPKLQHVDLLLDWVPSGEHAPFYLALAKGYYKAAGLDVQIIPGKGSVSTMQEVAAGTYPIGLASGSVVATGITKGLPEKVVADYFQTDPDGVIVLDKSNITKPQDLIGKSFAYAPGGVSAITFKAFEVANHIKPGQVKVVTTNAGSLPAALIEGKVDAVGDFALDVVPPLEVKGFKAHTLYYADWGVPGLATGIVVNLNYLKAHPDVVRGVVQASDKAWAFALAHPQQTIAATKSLLPATDVSALQELKLALTLLHTPNTKGKPIGWMSAKDWQGTLQVLEKYQGLTNAKPLQDYYTNQFIGGASG